MLNALCVGAGGFIGAVLRYLIGLIPVKEGFIFPVKTLIINVAGCFLIALITGIALKNSNLSPKMQLFLKTGICGGFTTFSTFALESVNLYNSGHIGLSILYVALSVILGISGVILGFIVTK